MSRAASAKFTSTTFKAEKSKNSKHRRNLVVVAVGAFGVLTRRSAFQTQSRPTHGFLSSVVSKQ